VGSNSKFCSTCEHFPTRYGLFFNIIYPLVFNAGAATNIKPICARKRCSECTQHQADEEQSLTTSSSGMNSTDEDLNTTQYVKGNRFLDTL